ncbi:5-oxoprolinase, HyuA-like domain / 5-oxoprolinase, HyuB-like domain, partial [hydrothermal vent metagenome]
GGVPTAFFVTEGFADLLVIGDQTRPDLFTLRVRKAQPLHARVVEVCERLDAAGKVLTPLDLDALRAHARETLEAGITVAAVALMHAWRNPEHEHLVRDALLDLGFTHVSVSSELSATIGFLARAETAVVNAFLSPVIDDYLDRVQQPMGGGMDAQPGGWKAPAPEGKSPTPAQEGGLSSPQVQHASLLIMTSAGSLIDRAGFAPKDSLLSGPAGGVVGAAEAGRRAGFDRVITFDMGGTSTDCARCEGTPERLYQTRVGEARIVAPCVAVETVAAGGGSVCTIAHSELRVGPESAGADPGPACYGRGGPLTITDCNLLLGRLDPAHFAIPLDENAARARAQTTLTHARTQLDPSLTLDTLLMGFLDLANQRMAEAIRRITLRKGHDPAEHAMVAFGGAGPQHACAIAETLGIEHVIVPPDAGLLSAFGLGVSAVERVAEEQILQPLGKVQHTIAARLDRLTLQACLALAGETPAPVGEDGSSVVGVSPALHPTLELRVLGQDDLIELEAEPLATLTSRFFERYRARFGYTPADTSLELVTLRVTATLHPPQPSGVGISGAGVSP